MKSFQEIHEDSIIAQHNLQLALQPVNREDGWLPNDINQYHDIEFALYELKDVIHQVQERCDK